MLLKPCTKPAGLFFTWYFFCRKQSINPTHKISASEFSGALDFCLNKCMNRSVGVGTLARPFLCACPQKPTLWP